MINSSYDRDKERDEYHYEPMTIHDTGFRGGEDFLFSNTQTLALVCCRQQLAVHFSINQSPAIPMTCFLKYEKKNGLRIII